MIKAYIEGKLLACSDVSFKGSDDKLVSYFKNLVMVGDSYLSLPSTVEYSSMKDMDAVLTVSVQEEVEGRKTRYKLRIEDVRRA